MDCVLKLKDTSKREARDGKYYLERNYKAYIGIPRLAEAVIIINTSFIRRFCLNALGGG